jgi:hypothetical protein
MEAGKAFKHTLMTRRTSTWWLTFFDDMELRFAECDGTLYAV